MKILLVSNLYADTARGGAERIVEREASALSAAGHEVVVVTAGAPGPSAAGSPRVIRYLQPNLFPYLDLHRHGFLSRLAWHLIDTLNARSARGFGAILDAERPDVVHTHNLMGLGFLVPAEIRRRRIRHVHTVHDVQLLHPSGLIVPGRRAGVAGAAYAALMRTVFGSPDVVVFPTTFLRGLHAGAGFFLRSRQIVVPNPAPDVAPSRVPPDRPAFLFVGQLERHKGIHLLLDAWQDVAPSFAKASEGKGASLVIVGGGAEEEAVRRRAANLPGVELLGRLGTDAVAAAYDRATHLVVPSLVIENAPTVILEAHARGVPVIAAATGGIPELIGKGTGGRLFAPGDRAALATAIRDAVRLDGWTAASDAARAAATKIAMPAHVAALEAAYRK